MIEAIENVKNFLRCRGTILWNQWEDMDPATKALFIEAGEQLEVERASLLAVALSGPEGAARVYSKVDGGDALVKSSLLAAVGRAVERIES